MGITKSEFDNANRNCMTVMENHLMAMCGCNRQTANLMANKVLEINRNAERIIEEDNLFEK